VNTYWSNLITPDSDLSLARKWYIVLVLGFGIVDARSVCRMAAPRLTYTAG